MNRTVAEILTPLDPHWDRIVRRPMSDAEIDALGELAGLSVPSKFRDYLSHIGLFQDLTYWDASDIQMYEKPSEFVSAREFLLEAFDPPLPHLFAFGEDGAGNLFCLPPEDGEACPILFADHETLEITRQEDFSVWLESVVTKVLESIQTRVPNERKVWCVEFYFARTSLSELLDLLRSTAQVEVLDEDWTNHDTTPAGVTSSRRRIKLNGDEIELHQSEYPMWEMPTLAFNMQEPVLSSGEGSKIRPFHALFKENCPKYTLIDYGPLDFESNDED